MSLEAERALIETHFLAEWQSLHPSWGYGQDGQIGFDGQTFRPPRDKPSIEVEIVPGEGTQISIGQPGANTARYAGVAIFRIRIPGGVGTADMRALADSVAEVMRNQTLGSIRTGIPYVQTRVSEPPFLGWSVAVPFQRDEQHA